MLLNTLPSTTAMTGTATDTPSESPRPATTLPPPPNGRALLPVLEQLAQQELARMVAAQPAPLIDTHDPAFTGLAWDLGLTGDALESAKR